MDLGDSNYARQASLLCELTKFLLAEILDRKFSLPDEYVYVEKPVTFSVASSYAYDEERKFLRLKVY
jgi:hypothetical protein